MNSQVPAAGGVKKNVPSGLAAASTVAPAGCTSNGVPVTSSGSPSGSVSLASSCSTTGRPAAVAMESLRASGAWLASSSRTATRIVP